MLKFQKLVLFQTVNTFHWRSVVYKKYSSKVHWVPPWRLYLYRTLAQPPVGCLPSYQVKCLSENEQPAVLEDVEKFVLH